MEIPDIFQKWAKNILRQHEQTPHLALMMAAGMNNAYERGRKEEREQFGQDVIDAAKEIGSRRAAALR